MITQNAVAIAYLIAGVMFILALRGLSSPETSRRGNLAGIVGMFIAVVTTLYVTDSGSQGELSWNLIIVGVITGGAIGSVIARRVSMTAMPQLVAGFHSFVGLAAVLVAAAALYTPDAYGIASDSVGNTVLGLVSRHGPGGATGTRPAATSSRFARR